MLKRTINSEALKQYLACGNEQTKMKLSLDARISIYTLDRMIAGSYPSAVRLATRERLCEVTGISERVLFPVVTDESA